jgi:hypothetical protein
LHLKITLIRNVTSHEPIDVTDVSEESIAVSSQLKIEESEKRATNSVPLIAACFTFSLTLKLQALRFSETLVNIHPTARRYVIATAMKV